MELTEDALIMQGNLPGSTSVVLVGIHGNERCGVEALNELLPNLAITSGRVIFILGNPRAIEQNVRFTEANLNRMFRNDEGIPPEQKASYEYSRAQYIKKYLDQADALLDVHASFTPGSRSFIIAESNSQLITERLPFNLVVSGFDATEPGGTDSYMNMNGKPGVCIECGYLGDPSSKDIAKEGILAFLAARGHISGNILYRNVQDYCHIDMLYITKNEICNLTKDFADFEQVSGGQLIGRDGATDIRAPYDGVILFAKSRSGTEEEAFLFGKYIKNLA